jgi:hypothetical protein
MFTHSERPLMNNLILILPIRTKDEENNPLLSEAFSMCPRDFEIPWGRAGFVLVITVCHAGGHVG